MTHAKYLWVCAAALMLAFTVACSSTPTDTGSTSGPMTVTDTARVRFVHAIADAPPVDVYAGDTLVADRVAYSNFGEWVEVPAGDVDISIARDEMRMLDHTFTAAADEAYTIIAYGTLNPVGSEVPANFLVSQEEHLTPGEDTFIRLANAVADGEAYALMISTGGGRNIPIRSVAIGEISDYRRAPLFENTFELLPANDTSGDAVTTFETNLQVGIQYTFVVAGRQSNNSLTVITVTDAPSLRM
jgi:hypothetical protein